MPRANSKLKMLFNRMGNTTMVIRLLKYCLTSMLRFPILAKWWSLDWNVPWQNTSVSKFEIKFIFFIAVLLCFGSLGIRPPNNASMTHIGLTFQKWSIPVDLYSVGEIQQTCYWWPWTWGGIPIEDLPTLLGLDSIQGFTLISIGKPCVEIRLS